ncbi:MAG: helix-turn-helix domain-containing protein [Pseudomonadales bacterium]
MNIEPIRSDADLQRAFLRLEQLWGAADGTEAADELEILTALIEHYEAKYHPIPASDPVEAIKFRMEQQGLTNKDLELYIGSRGRVSEILNHKRPLSLTMIKRLHEGLRIPYECLLTR